MTKSIKIAEITSFKDLTFQHLGMVEDFAKALLDGKGQAGFNQRVFDKLIDVQQNENTGHITLTIKN